MVPRTCRWPVREPSGRDCHVIVGRFGHPIHAPRLRINAAAWSRLLGEGAAEGPEQPQRICRLCTDALDVDGAGISLVTGIGNRGVVCSTDDLAGRIEQLQFTLGEGPCVDAVSFGAPVLIPDLTDAESFETARWPGFLASASAAGVAALFAFPLTVGGIRLGAMDLYRQRSGDLSDEELAAALLAADAAATALLHLTAGPEDFLSRAQGGAAYQMQVHQATGMVQVQLGISAQEALLRLRARAFATGQPLPELALDVIDRRKRFSSEDP